MPKLVVVMAAKDAQEFIGRALRTCLAAIPPDSVIVVWNDGSTDHTLDRIESVSDNRIRIIDSKISLGSGAARSGVMKATDSDYIACMDADDICLPWRFRAQLAHIQNVDASFMNSIKFGPHKFNLRPTLSLPYNDIEAKSALLIHNPIVHSTFFAKRQVIEEIGGYRDLRVAQDYDLWLRLATSGAKLGILSRPGIAYRKSSSQISNHWNYKERIRAQDLILESYRSLYLDVMSGSYRNPTESIYDARTIARYSAEDLQGVLKNFRPLLRLYYRRLLSLKRLGPLTQQDTYL